MYTPAKNVWHGLPVYEVISLCSRGQKWERENCHSHKQYLICMKWNACDLKLVVISLLNSKWQVLKVGIPIFSCFIKQNWRPLSLKSWHFEASEDIVTKLHFISVFHNFSLNHLWIYCNNLVKASPPLNDLIIKMCFEDFEDNLHWYYIYYERGNSKSSK